MSDELEAYILESHGHEIDLRIWDLFEKDVRFSSRVKREVEDVDVYTDMISGMIATVMHLWPLYARNEYFKSVANERESNVINLFQMVYPTIFTLMMRFHHKQISVKEILGGDLFKKIIQSSILFVEKYMELEYDKKGMRKLDNKKRQEIEIMTSVQWTVEQLETLIMDIGIDKFKEISKNLELKRRKTKDTYVNFSCRLPRKNLDWLRHYTKELSTLTLSRFMGEKLSEFVQQNLDKYPMLDNFGGVVVSASKRGRRTNASKGLPTKKTAYAMQSPKEIAESDDAHHFTF